MDRRILVKIYWKDNTTDFRNISVPNYRRFLEDNKDLYIKCEVLQYL